MNTERAYTGIFLAITLFGIVFSFFILRGLSEHIGSFEELKSRMDAEYCRNLEAEGTPPPDECLEVPEQRR